MQHRTASGHMDHGIHIDWESIQSWLEKVSSKERLAEIGVAVATLTIIVWTGFAIHKALENYQVVGPGLF